MMNNKKYILLLSSFIACTSMGMEQGDSEKVVSTFPTPINRFAVSPDGTQFVTSESEEEEVLTLRNRDIINVISTLRLWKKQSRDGSYHMKSKKIRLKTNREADVFSRLGIRWLKDNKKFAFVSMKGVYHKHEISYELYDAETLKKSDCKLDKALNDVIANPHYLEYRDDFYSFADNAIEIEQKISFPLTSENKQCITFYPNKVCIENYKNK